ncbi:Hypothetical protein FKW44_017277 [Caligus rogercresseyi]|uniref:Uncharacterized protein n=1 Tax=Caligus rogercresseyi TaxID=217165 RepID=A0A7T8H2Z1_CALRO|nr:Hypothetical protein FKW44_017277 [Caligus rogercresseyi]
MCLRKKRMRAFPHTADHVTISIPAETPAPGARQLERQRDADVACNQCYL